jgi:paraquat-inducible protein B
MAKQANRIMIGSFVVIAVIIMVASLAIFGSGKFFKQTERFVLHFDGSIRGLRVGSAVLFQGVPIGSVKSIVLRVNMAEKRIERPVVIEVDRELFQFVQPEMRPEEANAYLSEMIEQGLRATLATQSLIASQLLVLIDFFPNTDANLKNYGDPYPEVPTITSGIEKLIKSLENFDLDKMQENIEKVLDGIDRFVNNPELLDSVKELKGLLTDARRLVEDLRLGELKGLLVEARQLVKELNSRVSALAERLDTTLSDTHMLIKKFDKHLDPTAQNLNATAEEFKKLAVNAETRLQQLSDSLDQTLQSVNGVVSEDAPLIVELENTLKEISAAARSIRQLADELEQHPETLIQGKSNPGVP